MDTATIEYVLQYRLTDQTPRQRHYIEKLFTTLSDSGRNAGSRKWLAKALSIKPDTLKAQLLYIGSLLGDTAFRTVALPFLKSDSVEIRKQAVRCLGAYPHPENLAYLWEGIKLTRGLELHQRLWSLKAHGKIKAWKQILPYLNDSLYCNQQVARDILLHATDSNWQILTETKKTGG